MLSPEVCGIFLNYFSVSLYDSLFAYMKVFCKSLYLGQVAHQAGFCGMKWLGVFALLPGWDSGPSQGYPQH